MRSMPVTRSRCHPMAREVAYFVPGAPKMSPAGAVQLNDVYVDDRRIVYTVDRFSGGLYILEMDF